MFALWPGDWLNFSTFKPTSFGYGGQTAASEAGHIANTNVGSNRARTNLCFKKNGRQFSNKDFPRGQVNGFADNLDFEKIARDRLKNNTADPSHF
jgi:hypothetical protein